MGWESNTCWALNNFGDLANHPVVLETNFRFPGQRMMYRGKVRDMYMLDGDIVVMVTTDRVSAFDQILPRGIPYKGHVLNVLSNYFLSATSKNGLIGVASWSGAFFDAMLAWQEEWISIEDERYLFENPQTPLKASELASFEYFHRLPQPYGLPQRLYTVLPDPCVAIGFFCEPIPIEMVVRGYLAGHAFREYQKGERVMGGVQLPDNLKENDPLPQLIITPTRKGENGQHDEDISREEILKQGIVSEKIYTKMEQASLEMFQFGTQQLDEMGFILADAKYEFGIHNPSSVDKHEDQLIFMDEIHTPDSARFFDSKTYQECQQKGLPQRQMSKEYLRQWLIGKGFQGLDGQKMPELPDDLIAHMSKIYIELYERMTYKKFYLSNKNHMTESITERIYTNVTRFLDSDFMKTLYNGAPYDTPAVL